MKARFGDRLGGFAFRVTDDPQSTRAWKTGAVGEERLARFLSRELPEAAIVLHDRRIPGSKANIDHVIVAAAGIWVVDAKLYEGRVERRMLGPFWNQQPAVFVGGRNQTKLVRGMARQVEAVRASLAHDPLAQTVPISPAVCFVASDWGLFARPFEIDGVLVVWPQKLVERIASPGPLAAADVGRIASGIAASLPSAVRS